MSFWSNLKTHVAERLTLAAGMPVSSADLVTPPRPELGDLSFGCFKLAKSLGTNPTQAAKIVVSKFGAGDHLIEVVAAEGPYVNLRFETGEFMHRLIRDVESAGTGYGATTDGAGKLPMSKITS